MSVDPLTKKYPELTPYQFASNRPIDGIDQDGLEWELSTIGDQNAQKAKIGVATVQLAANSSPWQKAHPGEAPSRVANNPSNVGIPPYMPPSERQNAQVLFNIRLQYEGFNYDLSKKPGTKLMENKTYQNFSNNIALPTLEIASMVDGIGELRTLYKGFRSLKFFTVQGEDDVARLFAGGNPWPKEPTRAHLGEGLYTWGTKTEAEGYLAGKLARNPNSKLSILQVSIPKAEFKKLNKYIIPENSTGDMFLKKYSSLYGEGSPHGFDYIRGNTNKGYEHYFSKDAFPKLTLKKE